MRNLSTIILLPAMLAIMYLDIAYIVGLVDAEVSHMSARVGNRIQQPCSLGDRNENHTLSRDPEQIEAKPRFLQNWKE